ncbi:MAG: ATP-binding protein [Ignavibacteriales bacterium]|nr:ATP-binding protein [Ignavibacteriales bacterium]
MTLKLISSDEELFINADQNKIDQIITNLITNAIKFSNHKTTTEISVMSEPNKTRIIIKDQGQGIPADELDRLFKPFSKTSVKSTGGEKSTGLGLMIVKKIVEGHNGTITVESEVNVGTTFTIELPV